MNKKEQIKFYTNLLKKDEILLLKSQDSFFKTHYIGSPLNVLTNFSGTEGEAIIDHNGKIKIFVDTRYHLLVDKQVFKDIEVYKMDLGETFFEAFKKTYPKNTKMYVPSDILLKDYLNLDNYFDLRKYELDKKFLKNKEFNSKNQIFLVDKSIEKFDFHEKIEKLKSKNQNVKKMIIFDLDEISYLTNLRSFQSSFSSNFRSYLYLDFENSNYILFSDNILKEIEIKNLTFKKLNEFENYIKSINKEIVVDVDKITLNNFLIINKPIENKKKNLAFLASIKPLSVIEHLILASKKVDNAILNFRKNLKEGMSEFELVELFESELSRQGAFCPSFKTILALNENSASIHYSSYDKHKRLEKENIILLDCGGYFEGGYATDITRTFYFGNNPKKIHKTIYTQVLKSFIQAFLSNETNAKKLEEKARKLLKPFEKEGFYFNHSLGHGIGTSVHQNPPRLSLTSKDTINPYQIHSIEPGLYGKDNNGIEFGVRIENCVYFDVNYKRYSLSKFPFEEILIEYNLLTKTEEEFVRNWQENFKC